MAQFCLGSVGSMKFKVGLNPQEYSRVGIHSNYLKARHTLAGSGMPLKPLEAMRVVV